MARARGLRDRASFAVLVTRYQSRVRGYLRQLTRDPALADDLAQETFIRAWEKLSSFSGKGQRVSWLLAIAHRQFLQSLRKRERSERLQTALEAQSSTDDGRGASPSPQPDSDLADLPRLLSVLSEDERIALVLAYGHGMSHAEISEVTGMALGTVKSHIHRGKARIQQRFDLEKFDHA
ncbi:MAG: sigma-70 family RNA polymerase sigma factor [Gammaproteobacteria bacterium]